MLQTGAYTAYRLPAIFEVTISCHAVEDLFRFIQLTWRLGNVDEIYGFPIFDNLIRRFVI